MDFKLCGRNDPVRGVGEGVHGMDLWQVVKHHTEVEVDDTVAAKDVFDGVGVETGLVVKMSVPFVCGADATDGVGAAFKDFVQEDMQLDNAVAAHWWSEHLFVVSTLGVGDAVPGERIGTTTIFDRVGVDDAVGDGECQVNDAVATIRDGHWDLVSVGIGVVDGEIEAVLGVSDGFSLPAEGFVVGGIIAFQGGDVHKQAIGAEWMFGVVDGLAQEGIVGDDHMESEFLIDLAFAELGFVSFIV